MVPKDISYSNKKGKLNLYASSETKEAQGSFFDFIVGGDVYKRQTVDGAKSLVEAYGEKYSMGVNNYKVTPYVVDTFFFKENNHYNAKPVSYTHLYGSNPHRIR